MSAVLAERSHDRYELDDNGLTDMQNAFVREFVRNCPDNGAEAARRAGYSELRADKAAWELTHNPKVQAAMRKEQDQLHADNAPLAFDTIRKLMISGSTDSVRYQAAKDVLDRCGYRPVEKLVIEHTLSPEERQARILELQVALGIAKQVTDANQAQIIEAEVVPETAQK